MGELFLQMEYPMWEIWEEGQYNVRMEVSPLSVDISKQGEVKGEMDEVQFTESHTDKP